MFSKALTIISIASAVSAYPSSWVTNDGGNVTAYAVDERALQASCSVDTDGAYTCVSVSQDVTRVESNCVPGYNHPQDFTDLFNMRDQACDDIHCRTDRPLTIKRLDNRCNGYDLTMTLDGNYLDNAGKNAFYDITFQAFSAATKEGSLGQAACGKNPSRPPPVVDYCFNTGPTNIQVSTFGGKYSGQFMETSLSVVHEDSHFLCDFILGAVKSAAGRISPESSGVLGAIGGICG